MTILQRILFLAALIGLAADPSPALDRGPYSMEILVDGRPLEEFAARGTTYIEALADREYSVRLRNHTDTRIAVALSVDGLNSIDAKTTTARAASKWILGPYETVVLDGWQTSTSTARRFFFTTEDESYGAWLGKTRNLGVISAAVFRERQIRPLPIQAPPGKADAPAESRRMKRESGERLRGEVRDFEPDDDMAATGIGRELDHQVRRVAFRAEPSPAAVLVVRYEYRDALVRLGVLPRTLALGDPLERRERAGGFEDTGFAPDPFRRP